MTAGDVSSEVQRFAVCEQHAVDHGIKPLGCHRSTGLRGDRLRGDVGLLGSEAAVLNREIDGVTGRIVWANAVSVSYAFFRPSAPLPAL